MKKILTVLPTALLVFVGVTFWTAEQAEAQGIPGRGNIIEGVVGDPDSPFLPSEGETESRSREGEEPPSSESIEEYAVEAPGFAPQPAPSPEPPSSEIVEAPQPQDRPNRQRDDELSKLIDWTDGQLSISSLESLASMAEPDGAAYVEAPAAFDPERIRVLSRLRACLDSMQLNEIAPSRLFSHAAEFGLEEVEVESIVLEYGRPALNFCAGKIDISAGLDAWPELADEDARSAVAAWGEAIGLLEMRVKGGSSVTPIGTAFHIGGGLLLTAAHVVTGSDGPPDRKHANALANRTPNGQWSFNKNIEVYVNFTDGNSNCLDNRARRIPVTKIVALAYTKDMDAALLKLADADFEPGVPIPALPLRRDTPGIDYHEKVIALGFPLEDRYGSPTGSVARIFGKLGAKRAAPGVVRTPAYTAAMKRICLDVLGTKTNFLYHDCSVLAGNSGSAVISIATGEVVGLHYSGFKLSAWTSCNGNGKVHPGNRAYSIARLYADPVLGPHMPTP